MRQLLASMSLILVLILPLACSQSLPTTAPTSLQVPSPTPPSAITPIPATPQTGPTGAHAEDVGLEATIAAQIAAKATDTPQPATAAPTSTPLPTRRPPRTATPKPSPTPTPIPTHTPQPTSTSTPAPEPTPAPTPSWGNSGYWYRDGELENSLRSWYRTNTPGVDPDVRIVTLDSDPNTTLNDLYLTLGCISGNPLAYLFHYSDVYPEGMDRYTIGLWDSEAGVFTDDGADYPTAFTDFGDGIYIQNRAVVRSIIALLEQTANGLPSGQTLVAGVWDSSGNGTQELWSAFDPAGLDDALDYLDCYR